jgi:hypothetical protein
MKYDEEIERELRLEEDDFVDLFRDQEATDSGTRLYIKKLDFLRALGRLDSMLQLTEEEREELREKHATDEERLIITSEEMEHDHPPDERDEEFNQLLRNLSISGEYTLESIEDDRGQWAVERLHGHPDVSYSPERKSFAWAGDEVYEG